MFKEQGVSPSQPEDIEGSFPELIPVIAQGLQAARRWDAPIKFFYSEMRRARERDRPILDIGSSVEVDCSEQPDVLRVIEESHQRSIRERHHTEYASSYGTQRLRKSISSFFMKWGDIDIDPNTEVMVTRGIIDAVAKTMRALDLNNVIIPSWAPYFARSSALLLNHRIVEAPLNLQTGNFDIDLLEERLQGLDPEYGKTLMCITHPAAPIGTVMEDWFVEKDLIPFLKQRGIWLISDSYITSTRFDGDSLRPMISYAGFSDVGVEAITVSKELHLPGARAGGVVGNRDMVNALRLLAASEVDMISCINQELAATALDNLDPTRVSRRIAQELENKILPRFTKMGWPVIKPKAGIDMVVEIPPGFKFSEFPDPSLLCSFSFLRRFGVAFCPCTVLGSEGRDYLRLVLKQRSGKIPTALDQMREMGFSWLIDKPDNADIRYLQGKIDSLDLTRL